MANSYDESNTRSIGQIIGDAVANAQEITRSEIRLAKAELREEAMTTLRGAALLIAGAILGLYAFGMLLFTLVWAMSDAGLDLWLAALIVSVIVGVVATVLLMIGRSRIEEVNPKPEQTIDSVKEDVQWIKQRTP